MLGDQGSGPMVPAQDLRPGVPNGTRNGTRNRDPIPYFDSHLETSEGPGLESHGEPLNTEFNPRAYNRDPESGCPAPTRPTCQSPNTPGPREPGYIYIYIYIFIYLFFFFIYIWSCPGIAVRRTRLQDGWATPIGLRFLLHQAKNHQKLIKIPPKGLLVFHLHNAALQPTVKPHRFTRIWLAKVPPA